MIRKILKIQNVGLLQNAVPDGAVELSQVTAIYAENGRGKSTLASIMRSCQLADSGRLNARKTIDVTNSPEIEFLLREGNQVKFKDNVWSGPKPNIVVFDSEFVEQNVYSGFEIRPDQRQSLLEFALGDQTVQLKQRVDQLTQDIEVQTNKRTQAEKALIGYATPYKVSEFIQLQETSDSQQQMERIQKRIEAAKNSQQLISRRQPSQLTLIQFDFESAFSLLHKQIDDLEKEAENVVKSYLCKHTKEGFEDWIGQGESYHNSNYCPFCGQDISNLELIHAYQSYFNKAYIELKRDVILLEKIIETNLSDAKIDSIVSTSNTNSALIEAWKDQFEITAPTLNQEVLQENLSQLRERMLLLVSNKRQSPLTIIGFDSDLVFVTNKITSINELINNYNSEIEVQDNTISDFKKKIAVDDVNNLQTEIAKLKASQRRQQPNVISLVSEYQSADEERKRLDREKTDLRNQLDTLMNSTLNQYQISINNYLRSFGAEFLIEELKSNYAGGKPRTDYGFALRRKSVKLGTREDISNCHSFATTLSEADKRTLAFAFFVSKLKADSTIANTIVVFDDPVSSLDKNRRYQSVRLIASLARECKQLLVLSHDAYFVRELQDKLENNYSAPMPFKVLILKRVQNDYSAFYPCNIYDVCASDYYRHYRLVIDYVNGESTADIRDIAKTIRPLLEGYYHRRFPGIIPRNRMFGEIIGFASAAISPNPLVHLQPSLQELREVNDYASQFHHDTNPEYESVPVVDAELRSFANRALKLIYSS